MTKARKAALLAPLLLGACAAPPASTGERGVGTPGVAAYLPAGETGSLAAMLARCRDVPPPAPGAHDGLPAACAQLRHTIGNQPGNG